MRRVLRMIGLVFVMIGLIGLVSSGTSALAQFMDLPGEACFTAPPGGAQRVPQCTAPTGCVVLVLLTIKCGAKWIGRIRRV
jgi:hypothetical protein